MDLRLSFQSFRDLLTFPFQDPRWKDKLLIGSGLGLASFIFPLLPLVPMLGYGARLARAGAANDDPTILPEWDDWGDLLLDGARLLGVALILALPIFIIYGAGMSIYIASSFGLENAANSPRDALAGTLIFLAGMVVLFISVAISTLLTFIAMMLGPVTQTHVAVERRFGALFDFAGWWRILRANWVGFLLVLLVMAALYLVTVIAANVLYFTVILCLFAPVLLAPLFFYAHVVVFRLAGQAYGEGVERAGL